ncbi:MAG: hypothetical protein NC037_04480 [Bacteroides sp.]|nr:hypothetical protein [Bacillota bacterium]MCM1393879.1 hypothetical protein [[Eubacterium] siraeum]MCM1455768.1 hypothetical protein [Bacteroides sp.]
MPQQANCGKIKSNFRKIRTYPTAYPNGFLRRLLRLYARAVLRGGRLKILRIYEKMAQNTLIVFLTAENTQILTIKYTYRVAD